MASNRFIPPANKNNIKTAVITRYIPYNILAVNLILATNLPKTGPGTSAFITCTESRPVDGKIASANTNTPIPPIRWVKLLQKSIECESPSTFLSIEEPVVVKPLAVSKKASAKDGISPDNTNGNAPKNDNKSQDNDTITKPSFGCIDFFSGFFIVVSTPITNSIAITIKNPYVLFILSL